MSKPDKGYRKREIAGHKLSPESLTMSYGYDPKMSEGSIKPPIFQTSTFAFNTAAEGEELFAQLGGKAATKGAPDPGLIYSRFNNPNMEVVEDRLTLFDEGEEALVFSSGMAAITTSLLACAPAGSTILHSSPLYGASEVFIRSMMPGFGVQSVEFEARDLEAQMLDKARQAAELGPLSVIYTESPANPTNALVDVAACARIRDTIEAETGHRALVICDNTMMGPIGHAPLEHGADIVVYSLTKYVGGHSDLIAGGAIGSSDIIKKIRKMRNYLGTNSDAHTCWMLARSMETVGLRMTRAFQNARKVADFLLAHDKIENVRHLDFLDPSDPQYKIYKEQCKGAGSTFAFDVKGGKLAAFRLLDNLQLIKLAVSLGGTESLICHPGSTTHSSVPIDVRERIGFTDGLVRISIGIEAPEDLIVDLQQALTHV